nr:acyltransferase family protein [Pseudomonas sp. Q11]
MKYRPDIDGLRTIAVLGVILFHLSLPFIPGGFIGVDVFFVISGFLITGLIRDAVGREKFDFMNFYIRRARRLIPAAATTIIASLIISFLLLSSEHFKSSAASSIAAFFSASNIWFWLESGYFDSSALTKPLLHTWTLSVEEQFYLVWPTALVFLLSARSRVVAPAMLYIAGCVSLYFAWAWIRLDPTPPFFLMPFRIYEFAIGALLVWAPVNRIPNLINEILLALGLTVIAWCMATFTENTPFPSYTALLPCAAAALVIYSGGARHLGWLLRNRTMTWIGERSYSLYLTHWPVIVFYNYYIFTQPTAIDLVLMGAITLATAQTQYRYIEVPLRVRGRSTPTVSNKRFAAYLALPACLLISVGAMAYSQNGWEWRIASDTQASSEVTQPIDLRRNDWHKSLISTYSNAQDVGSRNLDAKTALIIGDSHAAHIRGAFDYIGKKYNIKVTLWYYVGCNPLFGTTHIFAAPDPREEGCRIQNNAWENHLKTTKYDYVTISSRWAWAVEPSGYGPYKVPQQYIVDTANPVKTIESSRKIFAEKLGGTVDSVLKSAGQVIVFAQSPNIGKSLDGCDNVPRYILNERQIIERCKSLDKATILQRQEFTNRVVNSVASSRQRVHAVIPTDFFCGNEQENCVTSVDGYRLFQDETHFTVEGAKYLAIKWEKTATFPFGKLVSNK